MFSRSYISHLLSLYGDAGAAITRSDEAVLRAREVAHAFTLAIALDYAAMLNVYRCDYILTLVWAEEAAAICAKHGFAIIWPWQRSWLIGPLEWPATLRPGSVDSTADSMRCLPFYYKLLGEICGQAGQSGEALANIATGFAFLSQNGEVWAAPELHRIQGDLLLHTADETQAHASYLRAFATASQIGSQLFEKRATDRLRSLQIGTVQTAER